MKPPDAENASLYGKAPRLFRGKWLARAAGARMAHVKGRLPPQHVLALLVAGLLCLMAAGVATMYKFGPARGHIYAALQGR
jgi:hypothetical protein